MNDSVNGNSPSIGVKVSSDSWETDLPEDEVEVENALPAFRNLPPRLMQSLYQKGLTLVLNVPSRKIPNQQTFTNKVDFDMICRQSLRSRNSSNDHILGSSSIDWADGFENYSLSNVEIKEDFDFTM